MHFLLFRYSYVLFCPTPNHDPSQIINRMLFIHYNKKANVIIRVKLFDKKSWDSHMYFITFSVPLFMNKLKEHITPNKKVVIDTTKRV